MEVQRLFNSKAMVSTSPITKKQTLRPAVLATKKKAMDRRNVRKDTNDLKDLNDTKDSPNEGKIKGQLVSWAVLCVLIVVKVL